MQTGYNTDKIVSGPIARTIFSLAVPVVLGMLLEFALSVTDFYWVGRLGPTAQDAITSSMVLHWTVFSALTIISIGVTALVARYVGARDLSRVGFYVRQAFMLAIVLSAVVTVAGYLLAPTILLFMGTGPATMEMAVPYLRIFFLSTILFALAETSYAVFRASGNTRTPMLVGILAVAINMILDPLLILGIGPFPRMGVTGAAVATTVAVLVAALVIVVELLRGRVGYRVDRPFAPEPNFIGMLKIAKIGLPITSQHLVFQVVYWFLIKIVHEYGETAGAAMGIGNRMESLSYLTCFGFSIAASTMVGQNLGAKKPDRAAKCAWGATGLAIGLTAVISAFFISIPSTIAGVFTDDPEVCRIASDYLFILGLSQATMAIEIVLEGAFSGAGNTIPPMMVSIPGALLRIPMAYYLCFTLDWGINGVWWTLTFTTIIKAAVFIVWFKAGKWKTKKI